MPEGASPGSPPSTARLLRGAPVAAAIRAQVSEAIAATGITPVLLNLVVGAEAASLSYLDAIDRTAAKLGIESRRVTLAADAGQREVEDALARAADDPGVHGILLQTPLPGQLDAQALAASLPPAKDVDGLTDASLGAVLAGRPRHTAPATAAAVVELLSSEAGLSPAGRTVCVIGRSLVVGRPLAAMLAAPLPAGQATVTICHSRTADVAAHGRRAEILVVAVGVAGLVGPDFVAPGAIVIDVGTHPVHRDGAWTLVGDVAPEVAAVAGVLTPVPGGVGPVTNAVLMRHVTAAALAGYLPPAW